MLQIGDGYDRNTAAFIAADIANVTGASRMISQSDIDNFDSCPSGASHRQRQSAVMERVAEFIERHYTENISLRDVARAFNYSPCHLTNIFSRVKGMPITAWIIQRKIVAAKRLLAEQDVDAATACELAGFNDFCYFTRQFVRHTGMTPARFRRSVNGGQSAQVERASIGA